MIGLSKGPTQTLNLFTIYLTLFLNNVKLIYYYYDLNYIEDSLQQAAGNALAGAFSMGMLGGFRVKRPG